MIWDEKLERNINNHVEYMNGYAEGEEQSKQEVIMNMYRNDIEINLISKCVNMSEKQIREIIEKQNNN